MSAFSEASYKLSPTVQRILKRAAIEAEAAGNGEIGIVHVFCGTLQEGGTACSQLLIEKEITVDALRAMNFKS